jgi:hypothetical protein
MPGIWIGTAILVVAASLRLAAAQSSGLWLDEIWSLQLATDLSSPFDVLGIRQDNNHPLNTLVLSLLASKRGPESFLAFRMPAVVAGVATAAVAGWIAWRRDGRAALVAMGLVGASSLMVHYSSEARGYAFAMFFATTSLLAVDRQEQGGRWCVVFNFSVLLGMLSHFSFAHAYGALVVWWIWRASRAEGRFALGEFVRWHGLPILFSLGLYWVYARALPVAGGPDPDWARLFARTGAMAVGLPGSGIWRWIGGGLALAIAALGIARLARRGDDRWVLYAAGIFGLPILTLLVQQPSFLAPRYFLMSVLLFLLLLAEGLGEMLGRERAPRTVALVLLAAFALGNLNQTRSLLEHGRGQYWRALVYMARHSPGPLVQVGSDHDIRVGMVLGYYSPLLPAGKQLAYHPHNQWPEGGPEWIVHHRHGRLYPLDENFETREGNPYRLEHVFPTGSLSGAHWIVYRNANAPPTREVK